MAQHEIVFLVVEGESDNCARCRDPLQRRPGIGPGDGAYLITLRPQGCHTCIGRQNRGVTVPSSPRTQNCAGQDTEEDGKKDVDEDKC